MYNRITIGKLILMLILLSVLPDSDQPVAQEVFRWKMVTAWTENSPVFSDSINQFTDNIKKMSNEQLVIEIFSADQEISELNKSIPVLEIFNAVSDGVVQMGHSVSFYWNEKIPGCEFMSSAPFGMTAKGMNAWLYSGGGLELWKDLYSASGILPFPMGNTGVQMGGWFNKKIVTIDDFKGLKIRMPGLGAEVLKEIGAETILKTVGEIFPALENGSIDAAEWIGPYHDMQLKLYKVAKYYYYPGWHEPGSTLELLINKKAWDSLTPELKKIIEIAAGYENQYIHNQLEALNLQALKELRDRRKIEVLPFPREVLFELSKISKVVMDRKAQNNPQFKRIYEAYTKFHRKNTEWNKITDNSLSDMNEGYITDHIFEKLIKKIDPSKIEKPRLEGELLNISLKHSSFDSSSAKIKKALLPEIISIAEILIQYPSLLIRVEGHTDSTGGDDKNMYLSMERGMAIRNILIQEKVDASRIEVIPFGETRPFAANSDRNGREKNRRVEIKVMHRK